jgi:hypothetical protein
VIDWSHPLIDFRLTVVGLVWAGMLMSALIGYIYTPNYRVRRSENPREFWRAYAIFILLALMVTYLFLFEDWAR